MTVLEALEPDGSAASLTAREAVYRCFGDADEILYIGTTGNFGRRFSQHAQKIWFLEVRHITLEWYPDAESAGVAERMAIAAEQPKYNLTHKHQKLPRPSPRRRAPSPLLPSGRNAQLAVIAKDLDSSPGGTTVKRLRELTGWPRSSVYDLLNYLMEAGAVERIGTGQYRTAPGRSAAAAVRSGRPGMYRKKQVAGPEPGGRVNTAENDLAGRRP